MIDFVFSLSHLDNTQVGVTEESYAMSWTLRRDKRMMMQEVLVFTDMV